MHAIPVNKLTVDKLLAARRPRRSSKHRDSRTVEQLDLEHLSADELAEIARTGKVNVTTAGRVLMENHTLVAFNQVTLDARLAAIGGEVYAEALYIDLPRFAGWHRVMKRRRDRVIVIM